jgi:hypothetical protein
MPMHDWSEADGNEYHAFHTRWMIAIQDALNEGVLPPDYYALAEQVTVPYGPDVVALQFDEPAESGSWPTGDGAVLLETEPAVQLLERATPPKPKRRIRHNSGRRLAAVIEIVSPSNKSRRDEVGAFTDKIVGYLHQGLHVLVLDPFPPSKWDKAGIHAAVWKKYRHRAAARPADKPLTLVAYQAGDIVTAYVEPLAVGDPLRDMPLYLTPGRYVNVPLEATYTEAWDKMPRAVRADVTGRPRR